MLPAASLPLKKSNVLESMLPTVKKYAEDFLSLFFPDLCCACGDHLVSHEYQLCTACLYDLPYTHFHLQPDNPVARQFWGRIPVKAAFAYLYFHKQGKVQNLIHHLKYKNRPRLGNLLGEMYGRELRKHGLVSSIDYIIPVPLHTSRLKSRGYNQSYCIAEGLACILGIPLGDKYLNRSKPTGTQTHKGRFERFENMVEVFRLQNADELVDKHILLVDDVITTGATLEACALSLLEVQGLQISILAIAYAE